MVKWGLAEREGGDVALNQRNTTHHHRMRLSGSSLSVGEDGTIVAVHNILVVVRRKEGEISIAPTARRAAPRALKIRAELPPNSDLHPRIRQEMITKPSARQSSHSEVGGVRCRPVFRCIRSLLGARPSRAFLPE
jgi:hypothetical protein